MTEPHGVFSGFSDITLSGAVPFLFGTEFALITNLL